MLLSHYIYSLERIYGYDEQYYTVLLLNDGGKIKELLNILKSYMQGIDNEYNYFKYLLENRQSVLDRFTEFFGNKDDADSFLNEIGIHEDEYHFEAGRLFNWKEDIFRAKEEAIYRIE